MKYLLTLCLCLCSGFIALAQSIGPAELNATGNSTILSGNTYEYAIGSITAGTYASASLVVTPGVLQPKTDGTGVHDPGITASDLLVFPNPADNLLLLQPRFGKPGTLSFVLTDMLGRTMLSRETVLQYGNERQEIGMSAFAAGQYTLTVQWRRQGQTFMSAFKIQKIN